MVNNYVMMFSKYVKIPLLLSISESNCIAEMGLVSGADANITFVVDAALEHGKDIHK